jgi:hypothetical protein
MSFPYVIIPGLMIFSPAIRAIWPDRSNPQTPFCRRRISKMTLENGHDAEIRQPCNLLGNCSERNWTAAQVLMKAVPLAKAAAGRLPRRPGEPPA